MLKVLKGRVEVKNTKSYLPTDSDLTKAMHDNASTNKRNTVAAI